MTIDVPVLSIDEAARRLGVEPRKIKQFLRDHLVFTIPGPDGKPAIPCDIVVKGDDGWHLLENLSGTLTLLADGGFSPAEAAAWLYAHEEELGQTPMEALLAGRHHRVNAIASALAL